MAMTDLTAAGSATLTGDPHVKRRHHVRRRTCRPQALNSMIYTPAPRECHHAIVTTTTVDDRP
ncbi:MAG: hypothetical protein IPJ48_11540 [Propionivibrio sp.]|uniref:Uncharacterized protein n=1 Tax=Candidatus Propionivibrio dominans TaxID=2954373 RepID=A0A9D7FKT4_9RHOO|nr:hypothetical protein [Candidatus Propionivibrio dominans]